MDKDIFIERHILIGLIVSGEYLEEVWERWDSKLLETEAARLIAGWCIDYYREYNEAPGQDIESIYYEKLGNNDIPQDMAEELEEDILPGLSEEYEHSDNFNVQYLIDRSIKYFTKRNLELHQQEVELLRERGRTEEAEALALNYQPLAKPIDEDVNLANKRSLERVAKAFDSQSAPIIKYPGALGEFMNPHLTRDAFVSFLAPEKRGKSWIMLDLAKRAVKQRLNIAFFQAGDMSEAQQLRRLGINLAKRSDRKEYTGRQWQPVKDCIRNQTGECEKSVREWYGSLEGDNAPANLEDAKAGKTFQELKNLYDYNKGYKACHNCLAYQRRTERLGTAWIEQVQTGGPLQKEEAINLFKEYFVANNRQFMLSTHPNTTLSINKIDGKLNQWYRQGFIPDIIIVDYADLLDSSEHQYRHKQDAIWKGLRKLSEERHCLVVSATQADASSYEQDLLHMNNFSEDKRKLAHANAIFGLNQDSDGREKEIGIMRINCIVARESSSTLKEVVYVLQNLKRGQPVLTSYW